MTRIVISHSERDEGGYDVRRPLATDAIGGALLRSYGGVVPMPEDMRRCLARLDGGPRRRA